MEGRVGSVFQDSIPPSPDGTKGRCAGDPIPERRDRASLCPSRSPECFRSPDRTGFDIFLYPPLRVVDSLDAGTLVYRTLARPDENTVRFHKAKMCFARRIATAQTPPSPRLERTSGYLSSPNFRPFFHLSGRVRDCPPDASCQ